MYGSNNCDFFCLFSTYLFVRAPFEQQLTVFAEKGRPDTNVVEVWARSVHSGARGRYRVRGVI